MTLERRSYNSLPAILQTNRNNLELAVTDDLMYEPEQADFVSGFIGDTSKLTQEDLTRTPRLTENSAIRQKYQFSIGIAQSDPITQKYISGAFYDDYVNHLTLNGALTDDPNRLFSSNYYSWSPPIDYDKIVNPARYVWTGTGTASDTGEYVTKEAAGSQSILFQFDGFAMVPHAVTVVSGLPGSASVGDIVEDVSTTDRYFYRWDGANWARLNFIVATTAAIQITYNAGDYIYVCRTGPSYNRPLIWIYRPTVGRWVSLPVVVDIQIPQSPSLGTIWEDTGSPPSRTLRIFDGTQWQILQTGVNDPLTDLAITYTSGSGPSGIPTVVTYLFDRRSISAVDTWSAQNWWRAATDLSASDKAALGTQVQAVRAIIEFWGNIEPASGDTRTTRNQFPKFKLYGTSSSTFQIVPITPGNFTGLDTAPLVSSGNYVGGNVVSTIFNYVRISGTADAVLGFPIKYASDGSPLFYLDLEKLVITASSVNLKGYRFFLDTATGLTHSVWEKSNVLLHQTSDTDGLYDIPRNLKSNPDHILTNEISRSSVSSHFTAVMQAQPNFSGSAYGANNYRFCAKNVTLGAQMIDPQETLFRAMAVLQTNTLDISDAIRAMSREYNSVMVKFLNQLNRMWQDGSISTPTDALKFTANQTVDVILTSIFTGRNEEFPFFYSSMGTYNQTRIVGNAIYVFDPNANPIFIPNSGAHIGTSPSYKPEIFTDTDGTKKLRGHDGSIIPAFNDTRDTVILALENRFFAAIPSSLASETSSYSSRFNNARFHLDDYYANLIPNLTAGHTSIVVSDYTGIGSPTINERVYSSNTQVFAIWDGAQWLTQQASAGDVFLNAGDSQYYIFNGFFTQIIPSYNNAISQDYSTNEFRKVIQREFERWVVNHSFDFITNTEFNEGDPFTWNYSSCGVEGHYRGIYRRVYHTVRPHSHPWEVVGYSIEPTWWRTSYVPTSTAPDGTPRYTNTHQMWTDFQSGIVNPITGKIVLAYQMIAPTPVDVAGALLDPIASGLITGSSLTPASLGDDWQFGDGALIEELFYSSYFYQFAVSLAGYLMKPGIFVDRTWSEFCLTIGDTGSNKVWNAPHIVYSSTLTRPQVAQVPSQLSLDSNGAVVKNAGFNSWIAEYANLIGKSANSDFNNAIKNSSAALGWKTSGFINHKRTSIELLNGDEIPFEDLSVVLHQGPSLADYYQSGLIVVRDTDGFRVFGTDVLNPYFRSEIGAKPNQGGQIETLETFIYDGTNRTFTTTQIKIPLSTNDTARFAVMINGYRMQDKFITRIDRTHFSIDSSLIMTAGDKVDISVITLVSNPSTQLGSFTANGVVVTYFQTGTGIYVDYPYGTLFATLSDVVNMMVGHGRWLTSQGWIFERFSNGSLRDWLNAAQSFVLWATDLALKNRANPVKMKGAIFEYSVMGRHTQFDSPFGMVLGVEGIRNGAYGVVDVSNRPIRGSDLEVISTGGSITVSSADTDIFGLRLYITEVQHVVFFPDKTTFGDIIYEPTLGLAQAAVFVDTYRTTNWAGRMEAPGFLISGGKLFPNWEKQINDTTRYYDRFNPVDDPTLLAMARTLYGYVPKSYMNLLGADDRTKFNFFHGSLKAKGTFQPYRAFIKGTNVDASNVIISEDWAWKFARYGDRRETTVLFNVNEKDFVDVYQTIYFSSLIFSYSFTGDERTSCFLIPQQFAPERLVVRVDDILRVYHTDYTIHHSGSGFQVCFIIPPGHNAHIVMSLNSDSVHGQGEKFFRSTGVPFVIDTNMPMLANSVLLSVNGRLQTPGVGYTVSDRTITGTNGSAVNAYALAIGNMGSSAFIDTATRGDGFSLDYPTYLFNQTVDTVIVAVDGLWQNPSTDYTIVTVNSHSIVRFSSAPVLNNTVLIIEAANPHHMSSKTYSTAGDGVTTQFNIPGTNITSYRQVCVALDGLVQIGDISGQTVPFSYTVTAGGILFNNAPAAGVKISIFAIFDVVGALLPILSDDRVIKVPQYSPPNSDTRWVVPPPSDVFSGLPFQFPVHQDGKLDLNKYTYVASLVDQTGVSPATELFHWDPAHDLHEPLALSKIEYKTPYDPARYNHGPLTEATDGLVWGENQVGQVWWDTSTAIYHDYAGFLPDVMRATREWGSLKYFTATITRTDELVTVTTRDPKTGSPVAHGLQTGQIISITGADQPTYNGTITVTVTSSTTFTFVVTVAADTPGTGNIRVHIGLINCYEWVSSPVPPIAWPDYVTSQGNIFDIYTGTVLKPESPSYASREVWGTNGESRTTYYFWVQNNTRSIPGKNISVLDIAGRLRSPFEYEVPFFGIVDPSTMFAFIGADVVLDGDAIEVSYQWYETPRHIEWILIGEGDGFLNIPDLVQDKLQDSLLGIDIRGNPVPNITLSPVEKYGTSYFPAQTVFARPNDALIIFVDAVNKFLVNVDAKTLSSLFSVLPDNELTMSHPHGYWTRETFWEPDIDHSIIIDTVDLFSELTYRTTLGLYVEGDVVEVLISDQKSIWETTTYTLTSTAIDQAGTGYAPGDTITVQGGIHSALATLVVDTVSAGAVLTYHVSAAGTYTSLPANPITTTTSGSGSGFTFDGTWTQSPILISYYRYDGNDWNIIGIQDHTIAINTNITYDADKFRQFYTMLEQSIDVLPMNKIVFALLFEMMRQNPNCDWFFKTSYIDIFIDQPLPLSSYVRPDPANIIVDAILDLKPYRTKIRDIGVKYTADDAMTVGIGEDIFDRVSLIFDRLACDLNDEAAWDTLAWDATAIYPERGNLDFTFIADGINQCYNLPEVVPPEHLVILLNNSLVTNQIDYIINPTASTICFTSLPAAGSTIEIIIDSVYEYFSNFSYEIHGNGVTDTVIIPIAVAETSVSSVFGSWNGVYQAPVDDFLVQVLSDSEIVYNIPPPIGVEVQGFLFGGVPDDILTVIDVTSNGVTTSYSTGLADLNYHTVIVIVGGVWQTPSDDFTINSSNPTNNAVVFLVAPQNGTKILIYAFNHSTLISSKQISYVGDGITSLFAFSHLLSTVPPKVVVNLDGIQQKQTSDFFLTNTGVQFAAIPPFGSRVEIFVVWSGVGSRLVPISSPSTIQWDWAFWDYANLGRSEYDFAGVFIGDGVTETFTVTIPQTSAFLYNVQIRFFANGIATTPAALGLTVTYTKLATSVVVFLSGALSLTAYGVVYVSRGLYEGLDPSFGYQDPNGWIFTPTPATYQHFFARFISPTFDPTSIMQGCPTPEERVETGMEDMWTIVVKTEPESYQPPTTSSVSGQAAVSHVGTVGVSPTIARPGVSATSGVGVLV
jgi:hypothetical protein